MKKEIPPELNGVFGLSTGLAILLFLLFVALTLTLFAQIALIVSNAFKFGTGESHVLWTLFSFCLCAYALLKALKTRYFLSLFAEWPGLPEEGSSESEVRLIATSARHAFIQSDFAKVPALIKRLPSPSAKALLAAGRALAMQGEFEDAAPELEAGGQGSAARRNLLHYKRFGFWTRRAYDPDDLTWIHQSVRLAGLGFVTILVALPLFFYTYESISSVREKIESSFSEADFKTAVRGRFTIYYHDEGFMESTAEKAEDALKHDLSFLGLPPETFAPGQIHLYLCADQQEYLSRSPFTRSWEAASAIPTKNQVFMYRLDERQAVFFEVVLAHELGHLCYHKVVKLNDDDNWLNEGTADYLGYHFALERANIPRQAWLMDKEFAVLKERFLPFETFLNNEPHDLGSTEQIHTFYTQGFSIVYVLIEQYGHEPFLRFLANYGAGKTLADSLKAVYPTIRNAPELHAVWALFMR